MIENISLPRYAYNVTFDELNHAVTKTFLESIFSGFATFEQDVLKEMKKVCTISKFGTLMHSAPVRIISY